MIHAQRVLLAAMCLSFAYVTLFESCRSARVANLAHGEAIGCLRAAGRDRRVRVRKRLFA
jgi:hypothetical protein